MHLYLEGTNEANAVLGKHTSYTIRTLTRSGDVASDMDVICASDQDVKLVAQLVRAPNGLEIWDGERLVAQIPPAGAKAA